MWLLHEFVMFSQSVLKCLGMACPSGHAVSLNLFWQLTCLVILTTCFLTSWHLRTFMFYFIHSHILASSTSTISQWRFRTCLSLQKNELRQYCRGFVTADVL